MILRFVTQAILFCFLLAFYLEADPSVKIGYGSCLDQRKPAPIWEKILSESPTHWFWLGDNIYLDSEDPNEKIPEFAKLKSNPSYVQLRKKAKIWGTWDDHDYGVNDAGGEYLRKSESQKVFLDFLDVPESDPLRYQEGIYYSKTIKLGEKTVLVIFLDMRYHRTPLKKSIFPFSKSYVPSREDSDSFLGKAQWFWLEKELLSKADLLILVSSIQVISETHSYEKWGNFPLEKEKLFDILDKSNFPDILVLSGDRHIAEVFRSKTKSGKSLTEFTSSSMNKPLPLRSLQEESEERISPIFSEPNFGILTIEVKKGKLLWNNRFISNEKDLFLLKSPE